MVNLSEMYVCFFPRIPIMNKSSHLLKGEERSVKYKISSVIIQLLRTLR